VPRIVEEWHPIVIAAHIVADVQDVKGTGTVDLVHNRYVIGLDVMLKERTIGKAVALPTLGRSIEPVDAQLDAFPHEPENAFGDRLQTGPDRLRVGLQMLGNRPVAGRMPGAHKGRVEGLDDQRLALGRLD